MSEPLPLYNQVVPPSQAMAAPLPSKVSPILRPKPPSFSYDLSQVLPSSTLRASRIPAHSPIRRFYLERSYEEPGPVLTVSPFIPLPLARHLMEAKVDSALAIKFQQSDYKSSITNLEGALHTFVTALAPIKMHGDTAYKGCHTALEFPPTPEGKQQYRPVILSTQIHLDFEDQRVAVQLYSLHPGLETVGEPLSLDDFQVPSSEDKHIERERVSYDNLLKKHAVYHLTASGQLPSHSKAQPLTESATLSLLESDLHRPTPTPHLLQNQFIPSANSNNKYTLSLEMMYQSYIASLVNELSALEIMAPKGYIYLYSPPRIFAYYLEASVSTRLMILALREIANSNPLPGLKGFAISDFGDPTSVGLIKLALSYSHPHVIVQSRNELFSEEDGYYNPPPGCEEATLVIHNNSDGFGQNIESEGASSLDGVVGVYGSGAAAVKRTRPDLVAHVI
ncbi:hypothetical protein T439DRAFT_321547 [Meredithblackwellia eburnea MCA 4105]